MPDPKQELTELIEAFATARTTDNTRLIQQAGLSLVSFLDAVDIVERASAPLTQAD